jgi:CheY-like chemotaxis protein
MIWRNRESVVRSAPGPDGEAPAALDGRWVLVIDDDPAVRVLSARLLLEHGAVCQLAATHESALQTLQREPRFAVALLDFSMPEGDGTQLVPRLLALRPGLRIIGSSGTDRRLEFEQVGVKRFLQKPWGIEELIARLQE